MEKKDKVAVFTSIRSEYGLMLPLLRLMKEDGFFNLRLMVGGAHLLTEFGHTIDRIKEDGFIVDVELPFLESGNNQLLTDAMALLLQQAGRYFVDSKPDLLLVLGDRFELLPVVSAALVLNIPIAHISGGDVTEGIIDNQVRHAITKMANLHFPATEEYRHNLLKMGEEDWRISVVGEPGLDEVLSMDYMLRHEIFHNLGLQPDKPVILATFHPETIENATTPAFVRELLTRIANNGHYQVLVTAANFDMGGRGINEVLEELKQEGKIIFVKSLGQQRYYSLLKFCKMVIGNSSSGLTEVQSFDIPVLNIGKRQKGRLANPNVLHVPSDVELVLQKMEYALTDEFRSQYAGKPNIYGDGKTAPRILQFLKEADKRKLLIKRSVF